MFNKETLVAYVLDHTNTYESFPFNKPGRKAQVVTSVFKQMRSDKITAMVYERDRQLYLTFKLTPAHVDEMTRVSGVERAYHMNKKHWVSVAVNDTALTETELLNMLLESQELTR